MKSVFSILRKQHRKFEKKKKPIETKQTVILRQKNLCYLHICCGDFPQKDASVNKGNTC